MFNVGDFVECLIDMNPVLTKGAVYKVLSIPTRGVIYVKDDMGNVDWYGESDFTLFTGSHLNLPGGNQQSLPVPPTPTSRPPVPAAPVLSGQAFTKSDPFTFPIQYAPDNMYDQVQIGVESLTETITTQRKKDGLCPNCGSKGHFHHFALVCTEHGEY